MLYKINDQFVEHSWSKTRAAHYGQGFRYSPVIVSRDVMAVEQKFTLHGLVFFPTDAQAMFRNNMAVKKDFVLANPSELLLLADLAKTQLKFDLAYQLVRDA